MNLNLRQNQIILKGYDDGLQPGQQLVLEIWPPLKSSPVHNHGGTFAIIKMLSGEVGEMKKFYPTKDFDFTEIKSTLNNEYYNNTCYTKDKNP